MLLFLISGARPAGVSRGLIGGGARWRRGPANCWVVHEMVAVAPRKRSVPLFRQARTAHAPVLSDAVAEQITALVRSGQLAAGSRLPPERELAEQLGVSRTVVREALRILEKSGLLRVKHGSGRFVSERTSESRAPLLADRWLEHHRAEMAELNHVLQLLEPEAVLEIPSHLVPQVACETRALYERAVAAIAARDSHLAAEIDCEFHAALCRCTPNRLLRDLILNLIASATESDSAHAIYAIPTAAHNSLDQHLAIVQALEAGSRDDASRLVREHEAVAYRYAVEYVHRDISSTDQAGQ